MKLNILILMAGESSRFDYKFKPFLFLDNKRFIEHCMDSFLPYSSIINSYNFIITKKQEKEHNVKKKLKTFFVDIAKQINVIQLEKTTTGPYQTIIQGLNKIKIMENLIICDCDHHVNINPIIQKIKDNTIKDIIVPIWDIKYEEQKRWGKIVTKKFNNNIVKICEKEIIPEEKSLNIFGMIGCYYFKSSKLLNNNNYCNNISDFLKKYDNTKLSLVKINEAYFFGTPTMVEETIQKRRRYDTIFCDVDGVLLKHSPHSNDNIEDNQLLGNCVKKFKKWKKEKRKIILCTARPKKTIDTFKKLLKTLDIEYDDLIMGLNPGSRYIINDIKPSNIFVKQSIGLNLIRDEGIDNIELNEHNNYDIEIIKIFKGNSFCKTYLLKKGNTKFVRKYIIKNNKTYEHYKRLKRQCEDLKRFKYYNKTLVPNILNENDSNFDYYFDIEYFNQHDQLDMFNEDIQFKVVKNVIDKLTNDVYCYKKEINNDFMANFFSSKIYPKLNLFEKECDIMDYLINSKHVIINNKKYNGLRHTFDKININNYCSKYMHPIHGDLTLENILYNQSKNDVKLIDMEGSRYVDSCLFDLGKIFQSIVSNYKKWNNIEDVILNSNINNLTCIDTSFHEKHKNFLKYKSICESYSKILDDDDWRNVFKKGIFYMSTYFIRFVQFRRQISKEHGIFAIIMAINWLNLLISLKEDEFYSQKLIN